MALRPRAARLDKHSAIGDNWIPGVYPPGAVPEWFKGAVLKTVVATPP